MALRFWILDRRSIRRLKPCEKITEHGVTAQRLVNGDLRYSVNVMVDKKRIDRVIGKDSEGVTRTQCEEFIERSKSEARAGRVSLPKGRKLALSFGAAADNYIKRLEEGAGKNITIKRRQLRMYLKPFFGAMRLDAITSFTVDRYKKRIDAGAASGTINRELATLSHLFSMAVEWKWLDRRPCRLRPLEENPAQIIALSKDQCTALMPAGVESADSYCWLFIAFGLNTAMRHSEILAARFGNIDFDKLRLFVSDAKAGQRAQLITPELAEMLRAVRDMRGDRDPWIFPRSTRTAAPAIELEWTTRFETRWCVLGSTPSSSPRT
jgi:integrase